MIKLVEPVFRHLNKVFLQLKGLVFFEISPKDLNYALEKYNNQQQIGNKRLIDNITTAYEQLNKQYKSLTSFLKAL